MFGSSNADDASREEHAQQAAKAARIDAIDTRISEVCGAINAAYGELVSLMGEAMEEQMAEGPGVYSPGHWLAWKTGMAPGRARAVAELARRAPDLPCTTAALAGGELSIDQAATIAASAPPEFEARIVELGKLLTVTQLRTTLRRYQFDPVDGAEPPRPAPKRSVSMGTDDHGWWLRARMSADEGAAVRKAIESARDDLYRQEAAGLLPDEPRPSVNLADGLVAVAEASLRAGEAAHPGSDRYLVHLHLETGPDGEAPLMQAHLGAPLPRWVRNLRSCDARLRVVVRSGGAPLSVGRKARAIGGRLRRVIEHRDSGCAVPGCGRTTGLEIHHIVHWEHGGPTDVENLLCLCRAHHRLHHEGLLDIVGPASSVVMRDRRGRTLGGSAEPIASAPGVAPTPPGQYRHPLGERLDPKWVDFGRPEPPRAA